LPYFSTLLNTSDNSPLSMVTMKCQFDDLLHYINIGQAQAHSRQIFLQMRYAEAFSHAKVLLLSRSNELMMAYKNTCVCTVLLQSNYTISFFGLLLNKETCE